MIAAAQAAFGLSTVIQPLGGLIACDTAGERITHASETIADILGRPLDAILGGSIEAVLPRDLKHNLRNVMSLRRYKEGRHFIGRHKLPKRDCDASVSFSAQTEHVVFEFETSLEQMQTADDFAAELRHHSGVLRLAENDRKLLEDLAGLLRVATGYDSVIVYRLSPSGGEVVAEARNSAQRSLLDQSLPGLADLKDEKADVRTPISHFIADTDAIQVPILSFWDVAKGLDLYYCHMRGLTDADRAIAKSLDVRSSMTVPLIMNSGLWGLAVLLNRVPRTPSRYVRQMCDALASVVCDRMQILQLTVGSQPPRFQRGLSGPRADLARKSVMVIEDNRLIAADLKLTLLDLGFTSVDLFQDEASALNFLASHRIDMAVLDIHLDGDATSYSVARKLADENTPFVFLSGYGAKAVLPEEIGVRPIVPKPATRRKLTAKIDELLEGAPSPQAPK